MADHGWCEPTFDDAARAQHDDSIRDRPDEGEVVRDEHDRKTVVLPEII